MDRRVSLTLLAVLTTTGAYAQTAPDLERIQQELARLSQEVELLKAQNAELRAQHTQRAGTSVSSAGSSVPVRNPPENIASNIVWRGDFRYRHEMNDAEEASREQTRHRIRARLGASVRVNESILGVLQIASNSGNSDPKSTTQTLTSTFERKGLAIDLAYVDWAALDNLNVQLGKMPMPWMRTSAYAWDSDLTPEGGALKFTQGPFFASAFGYWLSERVAGSDATLLGGQLGMKTQVNDVNLSLAGGYFDVGAVQGQVTANSGGCTQPFNPAFFNGAQGNSTFTAGGCPMLLNDFDVVDLLAQADFKAGSWPMSVYAELIRNVAADDFDTGYSLGFRIGRAVEPHTWELGYTYERIEKDAMFGQFVDSDFGGGLADRKGHAFRGSYAPGSNWILSGTYYLNKRFIGLGPERDYERMQVDLNYRL
jgi:hypothetical protein